MEIWPPDDVAEQEAKLSDLELYEHVTECADPDCKICEAL
jgi:hypothetical protein